MKKGLLVLSLLMCGYLYSEENVNIKYHGINSIIESTGTVRDGRLYLSRPPIYAPVDIEISGETPAFHSIRLGFFSLINLKPLKFCSYPFIKELEFVWITMEDLGFLNEMVWVERLIMVESNQIMNPDFDIKGAESLQFISCHGGNWEFFPTLISIPSTLKYIDLSAAFIDKFPEETMLAWANNPYGVQLIFRHSRIPEKYHHYEAFIVEDELDTIPREDREKYGF